MGVLGGWCGLSGIAFHNFSMGVPELGPDSVPRPLALLWDGKEIPRERGYRGRERRA